MCCPHQHWLLAQVEGECLGFPKANWSAADPVRGRIGAKLQKIYLLGRACGKGYGQVLMDGVLAEAGVRHADWLWLDVVKSNIGVQRFYQRNGFSLLGKMSVQTDVQETGSLVMARQLGGEGAV